MKNNGLSLEHLSPCLRIFIESLLEDTDAKVSFDEIYPAVDELALHSAFSSGSALASDKNYN